MKQYFLLLTILLTMTIVLAGPYSSSISQGPYSSNINKVEGFFDNETASVNASDYWLTDIGSLGTVNATQFSNNAGTLNILTGWLDGIWCTLTGCTMQGDITIANSSGAIKTDDYSMRFESGLSSEPGSAYILNTANELTDGDSKLWSLQNNDVEKAYFNYQGDLYPRSLIFLADNTIDPRIDLNVQAISNSQSLTSADVTGMDINMTLPNIFDTAVGLNFDLTALGYVTKAQGIRMIMPYHEIHADSNSIYIEQTSGNAGIEIKGDLRYGVNVVSEQGGETIDQTFRAFNAINEEPDFVGALYGGVVNGGGDLSGVTGGYLEFRTDASQTQGQQLYLIDKDANTIFYKNGIVQGDGAIGRSHNLLKDTETLDGSNWVTTGTIAITSNDREAPDGSQTADLLTTGTVADDKITQDIGLASTSQQVIFTGWLSAPGSGARVWLESDNEQSSAITLNWGINKWKFQQIVHTFSSGSTGNIKLAIGNGGFSSTKYMHAWGLQVITGDEVQGYTANGNATRSTQGYGLTANGELYVSGDKKPAQFILKESGNQSSVNLFELRNEMGTVKSIINPTFGWNIDRDDTGAAQGLLWGSSADTNLYRSTADTLKTDDDFIGAKHAAFGASGTISSEAIINAEETIDPPALGKSAIMKLTANVNATGVLSTPIAIHGIVNVDDSTGGFLFPVGFKSELTQKSDDDLLAMSGILLQFSSAASGTGSMGVIRGFNAQTQPTYTGGKPTDTLVIDVGNYGSAGITNSIGIRVFKQSGSTNNFGIVLDGDGAGADLVLGDDQDAKIYYDGTDLVIDPDYVGSGSLRIDGGLNIGGNITVNGNLGLTGNYSIGTCWMYYNGGIATSTNCTGI